MSLIIVCFLSQGKVNCYAQSTHAVQWHTFDWDEQLCNLYQILCRVCQVVLCPSVPIALGVRGQCPPSASVLVPPCGQVRCSGHLKCSNWQVCILTCTVCFAAFNPVRSSKLPPSAVSNVTSNSDNILIISLWRHPVLTHISYVSVLHIILKPFTFLRVFHRHCPSQQLTYTNMGT